MRSSTATRWNGEHPWNDSIIGERAPTAKEIEAEADAILNEPSLAARQRRLDRANLRGHALPNLDDYDRMMK